MAKAIFKEQQRFNQWWIWVVNILVFLTMIIIAYEKVEKGENPAIPLSVLGIVLLTILLSNLKTKIDAQGIHVQFFPFILNTHVYQWEEIQAVKVVEYSPIGDYGGWGYRLTFGNGRAFNIRGNQGIEIITSEGKKRIIGTQKAKEAQTVIDQYFSKTS